MLYFYALLCFFVPNIVWQVYCGIARKQFRQENSIRHTVWAYIFMFYIFEAAYDVAGIGTLWDFINHSYSFNVNLVPFQEPNIIHYILNIIMFMPLGFLLPHIWKDYRKFGKTLLFGIGFTLLIEIGQLFSFRATDIDDLIMNTLGTVVGYAAWFVFHKIFSKSGERSISICRAEPICYTGIGILGIVLLYNWRIFY